VSCAGVEVDHRLGAEGELTDRQLRKLGGDGGRVIAAEQHSLTGVLGEHGETRALSARSVGLLIKEPPDAFASPFAGRCRGGEGAQPLQARLVFGMCHSGVPSESDQW